MFGIIVHALEAALRAVLRLLAIILKIIYNILKFLHIRLLALYLAVCGLVQLIFRSFAGENAVWFWAGLLVCLTVTLFCWGRTLRKKFGRKQGRDEPVQAEECAPREELAIAEEGRERVRYPRYFDAEGREGYIFAEYADRYELYRREGKNYILERVDQKTLEKRE